MKDSAKSHGRGPGAGADAAPGPALSAEAEAAVDAIRRGGKRAVAQFFNLLEDRRPEKIREAYAQLDRLYAMSIADSHVVGITGPPGAGKSCLISRLIGEARALGRTVGVIAVDPSSRRSSGAILGDRIRYEYDAGDAGIFVRSMANRGELGGVSDRTFAGTIVLRAAFDLVFVETVGVGQAESDVADLSDTTLFVIQPGSGDMLQFLKAGIMEEPDLMVVNKSDQPQARRTLNDVRAALHTVRADGATWQPEALAASAVEGSGIGEILREAARHRDHLMQNAVLQARRHRQARHWLVKNLQLLYGARGIESLGGPERLAEMALPDPATGPFMALDGLDRRIRIEVSAQDS